MTDFFSDPRVLWALVIVVVLPVVIIAAGEVEERLRQRDSLLTRAATIIRKWTVPLAALWALTRGLFDLSAANIIVRLIATTLLLSAVAVVLGILRLVIESWRTRPRDGRRRGVPQLLLALPRVGVIIVAGWVLLNNVWGVDLSAALTALGVTSLVISFALQDTLSGLASGLLLLSDAPFQPGDWIKVGDLEGRVVDINWRSSRIETRNRDLVVVPNAHLAGSVVTNFDEPSRVHRVVVPVQVAFSNPPTLAKEMLLDAALSTPGVLDDPPPTARVVQIDDPLMGYEVDLWIDDFRLAPRVASDFGSLVWYQSHRHDVPLPSPAFDLYVYDGVRTGEEARPSRAEIRRRLRRSPLFDSLGEDDLERLAASARTARFQRDEVIIDASVANRDLFVLWQGAAAITVTKPDGDRVEIAQLPEGEVFGLLGRSDRWPYPLTVSAISDCELVVMAEQVAGEVTSRDLALSAALNQLVETRRRRVDRVMEQISQEIEGAVFPSGSEGVDGT